MKHKMRRVLSLLLAGVIAAGCIPLTTAEVFSDTIMKYNSFNNSAYFMNVINTIADKEDVGITIESKSIDNTELGITDVATQNTMLVVFVIIIPIAILVAGFVFWLRRRNR